MFDIGFSELLIFSALALIILGPEKLPQAARTAGQWYAKFRRTVANLQHDIETELDLAETRKQLQAELAKIRQTEAQMQQQMQALHGNLQQMQQQAAQNKTTYLPANVSQMANVPLAGRWFVIGDAEKMRRLPPAPRLPNLRADPLLNQVLLTNQSSLVDQNHLNKNHLNKNHLNKNHLNQDKPNQNNINQNDPKK